MVRIGGIGAILLSAIAVLVPQAAAAQAWQPTKPITIVIPGDLAEKVANLARRDFRRPKDQASLLVTEAIERAWLEAKRRPEMAGARR